MKSFLPAVCLLTLGTSPLLAQTPLTMRASDQFSDYLSGRSYEGDVLPPSNTGAPFIRRTSGTIAVESVADGYLSFRTDDTGSNTLSWQVGDINPSGPTSPTWWTDNADPETGFTVEFRVKALTGLHRFNLIASYDTATSDSQVLTIQQNTVSWGGTVLHTATNDDDFHIYRLVRLPDANLYQVWRDGTLIGNDITGSISARNRFWFGDWGGQPGGGVIDYIRWDTSGAYSPVPEPGVATLLAITLAGTVLLGIRRRSHS